MRKTTLFAFLLPCGGFYAQDTLYFKDNSKKIIVLLEVNPGDIKFKRYDNQAGAVYTVPKTDLSHIVFSNGVRESFDKIVAPPPPAQPKTDSTATAVAENTATSKPEDFFAGTIPDTLVFSSGKRTPVKVLFVNDQTVKYKVWQNQDGPTYEVYKSELKQIGYGNGKVETIVVATPAPSNENRGSQTPKPQNVTSTDMYRRGAEDAKLLYDHPGGSRFVGTFAFLTGPVFGLIPAVIISNCEPKRKNLHMPANEDARNPQYQQGYIKTAYKMKKKRVWRNYAVGSAILILLVIILSIS